MAKQYRILAIDTSLSCTGIAVLTVKSGKVYATRFGHCKTHSGDPTARRAQYLESWLDVFLFPERAKGFDTIVREAYAGKFGHHTIFSAWSATDRALLSYGWEVDAKPISAMSVKARIGGGGKADKDEVAAGCLSILANADEVEFVNDGESDAVAVGLTYLIDNGIIEKPKAKKKK